MVFTPWARLVREDWGLGAIPLLGDLLLLFPLFSIFVMPDFHWVRNVEVGGWIARVIHIALFGWLVSMHWKQGGGQRVNVRVVAFVVAAVAVCALLPPGGSAALLIMTFAFVTGSGPYALLGVALQSQFIIRYYYSLEMNLLNKSLLLMAVGAILLLTWWLLQRDSRARSST